MSARKKSILKIVDYWQIQLKEAFRQNDESMIKKSARMLTYWSARMREEDGKRLDEKKGRRSS